MKNKTQNTANNTLGSSTLVIIDGSGSKPTDVDFDFRCNIEKVIWAQQVFLEMPFISHQERGQPISVTSSKAAKDTAVLLRKICEYWESRLPNKSLWSWSEPDVVDFFHIAMLRSEVTEQFPWPVYSNQRYHDYSQIFNISHKSKTIGKAADGLHFSLSSSFKMRTMEPILDEHGLIYEEWVTGRGYPPVPLGICSVLLMKAIDVLDSKDTALTLALYAAWNKNPDLHKEWLKKDLSPLDLLKMTTHSSNDHVGLLEELQARGLDHHVTLPWLGKQSFREYRRRVIGACVNINFVQSGHRAHEFLSIVSNDRKHKKNTLYVKQRMGKSLDGLKIYRPLADLSARAAETLWTMSFVDPNIYPVPLLHPCDTIQYARMMSNGCIPTSEFRSYGTLATNQRLNAFYRSDVFSVMPEAQTIHPTLSTHQFRHSFAEFTLRRFDEDVHESLREHFVQKSDYATQIYERKKLDPAVQSMLERKYLYEIIGKAAQGKLSSRFWGPAFSRIQKEIDKIKFLHPSSPAVHYEEILKQVERFSVFEWGFCVLFTSSTHEAKCKDSTTGLPEIDSLASAARCTNCPNNMGNSIQKNNLLRTELAFSELGRTHPIKAIGRLCTDIANNISRRTKI